MIHVGACDENRQHEGYECHKNPSLVHVPEVVHPGGVHHRFLHVPVTHLLTTPHLQTRCSDTQVYLHINLFILSIPANEETTRERKIRYRGLSFMLPSSLAITS